MISTKRPGLKRWFTTKPKTNPSKLLGKDLLELQFCMTVTKLHYENLPVTIPHIVLICCEYLRKYGSNTCGIFRVSGSLKRIQALQTLFETNPNGNNGDLKELGFTPFDVAGMLTRFLKSLPEPVINLFDEFRQILKSTTDNRCNAYQQLFSQLPRPNSDLLLYLLDFLNDLSKNSSSTKMPAVNLSAVFQPSLLSLPSHVLIPDEYQLSQEVITFLIINFQLIIPDASHFKEPSHKRKSSTSIMVKRWLYRSNSTSSTLVEDNPSTYRTSLTSCRFDSPPLFTKPSPVTNNLNFLQRTLSQLRRVR